MPDNPFLLYRPLSNTKVSYLLLETKIFITRIVHLHKKNRADGDSARFFIVFLLGLTGG